MATFHSVLSTTPNHLMAIGRVCVQWTIVEHTLESLVWSLSGTPHQFDAQAITCELQFPALVKIARTQVNMHLGGTDLELRFKQLMNRLDNELRPKRNEIVHGMWGPCGDASKVSINGTTARGVLKHVFGEPLGAEDILDVAAEIDHAHFELLNMLFELGPAVAASRRANKHPQAVAIDRAPPSRS